MRHVNSLEGRNHFICNSTPGSPRSPSELRDGWFLIKCVQCSYSVYVCGPRSCFVGSPAAITTHSQRRTSEVELQLRNSCLIRVSYHSHSPHMAADEDMRAAHNSFRDLKNENLKSFQRISGPYYCYSSCCVLHIL